MLREGPGGTYVEVRVVPRAAVSTLAGERDGALLVRLAAPPVDGKANEALRAFLAGIFDVPKRRVTLVHGETSRHKRLLLEGLSVETARRCLEPPP